MLRKRALMFYVVVGIASMVPFIATRCEADQVKYKFLQSWGSKGSGDGEFNGLCGIAVDENDQVYVADAGNCRIQKLTADGKFLAKWKTTNQPRAIAVDTSGNVYVAEAGAEKGLIEKFTPEGKLDKKWEYQGCEYKSPGGKVHKYSMPGGITISGKHVYLGNNSTGSVEKFTGDGKLVKSWGNLRQCCGFLDVAVDEQGNVYVAELGAHRVQVFDPNGKPVRTWGKSGKGEGQFCGCCNPVHIALGPGNKVFTTEKSIPRIQVFTTNGQYVSMFGKGKFSNACGYMDIAVSSSGKVYVVDDAACRIHVFGEEK